MNFIRSTRLLLLVLLLVAILLQTVTQTSANLSSSATLSASLWLQHDDDNQDTVPVLIALGQDHSCAVDNHSKLKCWGRNNHSQVGNGRRQNVNTPTLILLSFPWQERTFPSQLALGGSHSCAIDNKNKLKCCGNNKFGQVGNGR